jgi:hypothetical protein
LEILVRLSPSESQPAVLIRGHEFVSMLLPGLRGFDLPARGVVLLTATPFRKYAHN